MERKQFNFCYNQYGMLDIIIYQLIGPTGMMNKKRNKHTNIHIHDFGQGPTYTKIKF